MKQILFTKQYTAELVEVDKPKPQIGEVLVRTLYTAISSRTERENLIGVNYKEYS